MIRSLRGRHRTVFVLLALFLPPLFLAALAVRPAPSQPGPGIPSAPVVGEAP